jgi:hypothetical protein
MNVFGGNSSFTFRALKTKDVVWIVSNCNTPSKREKYVKEMQKIINVDIFGRCGKPCVKKGIDCIQNLSKYYKVSQ